MIPFLDLRAGYDELRPEIDAAISRVLDSGMYILGEEVAAFEREYAAYCGCKHAIGVANGLDALHLALRAMDVGPGDEVIVPSNTYIATWLAVSQCGATPVPVEPVEGTSNLDPALVEAALAERLRVLRNYGSRVKYVNDVQGWNSRLDPLQAAVLRVKLAHLDDWNARRRAIAARYLDGLRDAGVALPEVPDWAEPAWHLFVVRSPRRDALQARLGEAGIGTLIHYPLPPHRQQAYAELGFSADAFPIANRLADQLLSLPIGPHQPEAATSAVIDAVRAGA
ncbi:DegT/DnrJ/EryC1/StrS family aminotransferase [Thermomonas sp.]|uniref:DegT/DnrJ/EryC1/StrS family aminotransferase n=1 Tax=Thermomonas sp. TaxID=1971895 RepID=UPI0026360BE3|nr:DegT/DnrJ/EryC1/StrS family aminotransferase [Thermomonas sp.]MBL0227546.1 DegT/DnrJ/EryC1/StrS family aminotransferase [Thermomonas sp.]